MGEGGGGAKGEDADEDLGGEVFVDVFSAGVGFVRVSARLLREVKRGHTCVVEIERRLWTAWEGYFPRCCEICRRFISFEAQSVLSRTAHSLSATHRVYAPGSPAPW